MSNKTMADVLIERIREDAYSNTIAVDVVERVIRAYFDEVMNLPKPSNPLGFDRGRP